MTIKYFSMEEDPDERAFKDSVLSVCYSELQDKANAFFRTTEGLAYVLNKMRKDLDYTLKDVQNLYIMELVDEMWVSQEEKAEKLRNKLGIN